MDDQWRTQLMAATEDGPMADVDEGGLLCGSSWAKRGTESRKHAVDLEFC